MLKLIIVAVVSCVAGVFGFKYRKQIKGRACRIARACR